MVEYSGRLPSVVGEVKYYDADPDKSLAALSERYPGAMRKEVYGRMLALNETAKWRPATSEEASAKIDDIVNREVLMLIDGVLFETESTVLEVPGTQRAILKVVARVGERLIDYKSEDEHFFEMPQERN